MFISSSSKNLHSMPSSRKKKEVIGTSAPASTSGKASFFGLDSDQTSFTVNNVGKERLDAFLSAKLPTLSRSKVSQSIKEGNVTVNGTTICKPASKVKRNDVITFLPPTPPPVHVEAEAMDLPIVYEDSDIIVLNKPPHLVVHPAPGRRTGTLVNGLLHHFGVRSLAPDENGKLPVSFEGLGSGGIDGAQSDVNVQEGGDDRLSVHDNASSWGGGEDQSTGGDGNMAIDEGVVVKNDGDGDDGNDDEEYDMGSDVGMVEAEFEGGVPVVRPGIVHRLDKGTTGILVVAKTNTAHARLAAQFANKTSRREYWALLNGCPSRSEGTVKSNIIRSPQENGTFTTADYGGSKGKTAVSHFKVLQSLGFGAASLVAWRLETGRTHQIRVHARHIGYPLLGDVDYGGSTRNLQSCFSNAFGSKRALQQHNQQTQMQFQQKKGGSMSTGYTDSKQVEQQLTDAVQQSSEQAEQSGYGGAQTYSPYQRPSGGEVDSFDGSKEHQQHRKQKSKQIQQYGQPNEKMWSTDTLNWVNGTYNIGNATHQLNSQIARLPGSSSQAGFESYRQGSIPQYKAQQQGIQIAQVQHKPGIDRSMELGIEEQFKTTSSRQQGLQDRVHQADGQVNVQAKKSLEGNEQVRAHKSGQNCKIEKNNGETLSNEQYQELKVVTLQAVEKLGRPALHARLLGFKHPRKGSFVEYCADMPQDMVDVVNALQGNQ